MTTLLIGAKWDGHDSSMFVADPEQGAAFGLSTERVTRFKHDRVFPVPALDFLLASGALPRDVGKIVFRDAFSTDEGLSYGRWQLVNELAWRSLLGADTAAEFEAAKLAFNAKRPGARLARLVTDPHGRRILGRGLLAPVARRRSARSIVATVLRSRFPAAELDIGFVDHEFCHVLSASATAAGGEALVVAMDGSGDNNDFTAAYVRDGAGVLTQIARSAGQRRVGATRHRLSKLCSPGGIYSLVTQHLGFRMDSDEGKTEALAAYGQPLSAVLDELIAATKFDRRSLVLMVDADRVEHTLARLPVPEDRDMAAAIAATAQAYLEAAVLPYLAALMETTGQTRLALAGGVFANVVLNLRVFEEITADLHITPAMGDDGSAQGACVASGLAAGLTPDEASAVVRSRMPFFGTSFRPHEIERALRRRSDVVATPLAATWHRDVASALHGGAAIAVARGRMEWGPRALGHRSVLVSAATVDARDQVNRLKGRPDFQPVCPVIRAENADDYLTASYRNAHMTCAFRVRETIWRKVPAIAHVDGTARAQVINAHDAPDLHAIATALHELDSWGVLLNTSFNRHGRTIVMTADHALRDFVDMSLDGMILGDLWVRRCT